MLKMSTLPPSGQIHNYIIRSLLWWEVILQHLHDNKTVQSFISGLTYISCKFAWYLGHARMLHYMRGVCFKEVKNLETLIILITLITYMAYNHQLDICAEWAPHAMLLSRGSLPYHNDGSAFWQIIKMNWDILSGHVHFQVAVSVVKWILLCGMDIVMDSNVLWFSISVIYFKITLFILIGLVNMLLTLPRIYLYNGDGRC